MTGFTVWIDSRDDHIGIYLGHLFLRYTYQRQMREKLKPNGYSPKITLITLKNLNKLSG